MRSRSIRTSGARSGSASLDSMLSKVGRCFSITCHFPWASRACTRGSAAVHHRAGVVPQPAVPDDLPLDHGILAEHRPHRLWKAVVDGVAEVVSGEAEAQVHRLPARSPLNGVVATLDPLGELLRPGPENRFDTAFNRQRFNRRAERGLR